MGIGIDYGIYLMSRMVEERKDFPYAPTSKIIRRSLITAGRAIFFTAVTMSGAMIIWVFFTDLRFQAEIGLLLAIVLAANFVASTIFVPLGVISFNIKGLRKADVIDKIAAYQSDYQKKLSPEYP